METSTFWKCDFHGVELWLPRRGAVIGTLLFQIIYLFVVVEAQVFSVSPTAEDGKNAVLLLGSEQFCAVVIAVVGAVTAEVSFQLVAQRCVVLALHILKQCLEAVGGAYLADLLEMGATPPIPLRG